MGKQKDENNIPVYNMIWNKVHVEDEPMFAELQGFKAAKAVAGT